MKKHYYILLSFLVTLLTAACYDDKGNYDYTEIDSISISKIDASYTLTALQDTLRICPEVTIANSEAPFTYIWTIRSKKANRDIPADTIGTEQTLAWPVNIGQGSYEILLQVTDFRKLEKFYTTELNVVTPFSRGFYVLKETPDHNSELDLHLPDQSRVDNLIAKSTGQPLPGKPHTLGYKFGYCYINPATGTYEITNVLTLCTEKEAIILKTENLNILYNHATMFIGEEPVEEPLYIYNHPYGLGYVSSRGHYQSYQTPSNGFYGAGKFGFPQSIYGDCSPDQHVIINSNSLSAFFYDQLNQCLLECAADGFLYGFDDDGIYEAPASPNNIPYQMRYFGKNDAGFSSRGYAIFKDENQNNKHYIYEIDLDLVVNQDYSNPIMQVQEIPADNQLNKATCFAINEQDAKVIYFVTGNRLYMYDIDRQSEIPLSPEGLPADEEITYLSNRFWLQPEDADNNFNYLAIGTYKNGEYHIYLYNTLGGEPQGAAQQILKGEGKAVMMQYSSPQMVEESYLYYPGSMQ